MLEEAVKAIQNRSGFNFSLEKLNQIVSNLVDGNADIARKMHLRLKGVCEEHIKSKLAHLESTEGSGDRFRVFFICLYTIFLLYLQN